MVGLFVCFLFFGACFFFGVCLFVGLVWFGFVCSFGLVWFCLVWFVLFWVGLGLVGCRIGLRPAGIIRLHAYELNTGFLLTLAGYIVPEPSAFLCHARRPGGS